MAVSTPVKSVRTPDGRAIRVATLARVNREWMRGKKTLKAIETELGVSSARGRWIRRAWEKTGLTVPLSR